VTCRTRRAGCVASVPDGGEVYARAALTYLAEPGDRLLARLVWAHGAARVVGAVRDGRLPPLPAGTDAVAARRGLGRWQARLPELPAPGEVRAFCASGIRLVCPGDPEWPAQLAALDEEQPYALWVRGSADLGSCCRSAVTITGARAATAYGSYVASDLAGQVAARGVTVVSGGSFGVEAAAHRGALAVGGATVAVLCCGVDVSYPAGHAELLEEITSRGAIVSEWPPASRVSRLRFAARGRLLAALSGATLVVESALGGGALGTARRARDLGRPLMAVPGPVTSDLSAGCHQVIREWGGRLVTGAADVLDALGREGAPARPDPSRGLRGDLGTLAGELLRDSGRARAGGVTYLVVIPPGCQPGDPVVLRREGDGRALAVNFEARVRDVGPEAGQ
jgi:DNA processing protein